MIYVCIPSHDEGPTVGLVLWKIRKVFGEFGREYQLLVADDASTDRTAETLEPYLKVLPLTVVRNERKVGYAGSMESLLRLALERSDRPRRDCAVVMHADFSHGPQFLPDMVRQMESGADLVVAEATLSGRAFAGPPDAAPVRPATGGWGEGRNLARHGLGVPGRQALFAPPCAQGP